MNSESLKLLAVIDGIPEHSLYGKISIEAAATAINTLSAEALKLWLKLALNQSGFVYKLDADTMQDEYEELLSNGFLYMNEAQLHFTQESYGCVSYPDSWIDIYEHYGATGTVKRDLEYVRGKLSETGILEHLESFLCYWKSCFNNLGNSRPNKVHSTLRYDCSKVRLWYLQKHFLFEAGDVVVTGRNAELLRFHDDECKRKIQTVLWKHSASKFVMNDTSLEFWNKAFSKGWFEMKPEAIGRIISERKSC